MTSPCARSGRLSSSLAWGVFCLFGLPSLLWSAPDGAALFKQHCASCHGDKGEGVQTEYAHPLIGDRSLPELTEYIDKTMPEGEPEAINGEEAAVVSRFVFDTFYSPIAQARNRPARVDLSRLTVRQHRNVVADLIQSFRWSAKREDKQGLTAEYFKNRRFNKENRVIERVDPQVNFDFGTKSPEEGKIEDYEFSIKWSGTITPPETGAYELIVHTEHAARLWINDTRTPLIDAWVKSGNDEEYQETMYLLGGRTYPIRLEFSKAKQGVNDADKQKEKPTSKPASIKLLWKRPGMEVEPIASRFLAPGNAPETFILSTPFPPDDRSVGYERAASVSREWDQATTEAAIDTANYVVDHIGEFSATKKDAADRDAKLREFCAKFTERAFRRPLTEEERQLYIDQVYGEAGEPELGVRRVVLLAMKSPRFLFREVEQQNDAWDIASRLSFTMWDSMPDRDLREAVAKGNFVKPEQMRQQAERMSRDPRADAKLHEFFMRWLKVEQHPDLTKDKEKYPGFDAQVAADLRNSLELTLDEFLRSDATDLRQLFLTKQVYLNDRLAKFYGAQVPEGAEYAPVVLTEKDNGGILTHPYLMAGFAYTATSSPIHRGVFISRSVLGRALRTPPVAVAPLAPDLHAGLTTRERVSLQTSPEACQSCHTMINPLGFSFEHFDAVGRYRDAEQGKPIDAKGTYRDRKGDLVPIEGASGLAKFLADSDEVHTAFVDQLFQYCVKQSVRAYGPEVRNQLKSDFQKNNFNIRKLLVDIGLMSSIKHPAYNSPTPGG